MEITLARVPNSYTLVQGTSRDVLSVGGHCDRRDAIFNVKVQNLSTGVDVPYANGAISAAGCDVFAVTSKVKGINVLIMPCKGMPDLLGFDIPDLSQS